MHTERDLHRPLSLALPRSLSLPAWLLAAALGIAALLPRCLGLADFFTIDEPYHWIGRVRLFAEAVRMGDWAATNLTGHPGVTTMWLGALGRWLGQLAGVEDRGLAGAGATYLAALRLPLAVVNSAAVVAGYLVLRRLLRPSVALAAGVLWATSPFLIGHSRLLHLDALLTSFMALSILLLLVGIEQPATPPAPSGGAASADRRPWLAVLGSGGCCGLALLTKAPALLLPPLAGMLLFTLGPRRGCWPRLRWAAARYALWLGCAALVVLIGWPALWVAPWQAIGSVINEIVVNGGQPHHSGNYFLGQPVADPGWLFYPAVVLWRSTPQTLLGLALLPLALREREAERRTLLALGGFVLVFGAAMSVEPKKFDRYLLPVWPALEVLAAAGLMAGGRRLVAIGQQWISDHRVRTGAAIAAGALFSLVLAADLAWYHPYYLAYFNPLLGGGATAQRVLLVGWGEGMEHVGAWLRSRPDLNRGPVLSWIPPTLMPFVPASTQVFEPRPEHLNQPSSYAVVYSRSSQRQELAASEAIIRRTPPLYTLYINGAEYASIYQLPRPFAQPLDAVFGDGVHLRGFSQKLVGTTLVITPSWDIQTSQPGGVFVFLHVLADDGRRVAQVDAPLDQGMFADWQAGQQFDSPFPLTLPPALPPGRYRVVLGLYTPADGVRLPLVRGPALPAQVDGPHALLLTTFTRP
jgi:4-amino-4-deoxy-L-arabinose transferase-like glycosyltransferase